MQIHELALFAVALLTLFNPPGSLASFVSLTEGLPPNTHHRMALQIALSYALVLVLSIWVGQAALDAMGISLSALRLAGGFLLLRAAVEMGEPASTAAQQTKIKIHVELPTETTPDAWRSIAIVPLTFPITVGGATVAAAVGAAGAAHDFQRLLGCTAVVLGMTVVVWLVYRFGAPLVRRLPTAALAALAGVSRILLICISFEILARGLRELLPGLGG
jgi:multiple antibiotic resistance protein